MAIFYVNVKVFSRAQGQTATAAAAYRAGIRLVDERTGVVHDYRKRDGVESASMLAPTGAPSWASDPAAVWSAAEMAETRVNARVARELLVALPAELDAPQRQGLATAIAQSVVDRYGVAVLIAIHSPGKGGDDRNHHVHLLMTTRSIDAAGFGPKVRVLDDRKTGPLEVVALRDLVATLTNHHLKAAGQDVRVDPRSLKVQAHEAAERGDLAAVARLARSPQRHEGKAATAVLRRSGTSRARQRNQELCTDNAALADMAQRRVAELHRERDARVRRHVARHGRVIRPKTLVPTSVPRRPRRLPQETRNPYLAGLADTVAFARRLASDTLRSLKRLGEQAEHDRARAQEHGRRAAAAWWQAWDDRDLEPDVPASSAPVKSVVAASNAPGGRSANAVVEVSTRPVLPSHPSPEHPGAIHGGESAVPDAAVAASTPDVETPRVTAKERTRSAGHDPTATHPASGDAHAVAPPAPSSPSAQGAATDEAEPRPSGTPRNRRQWAELRRKQRGEALRHGHGQPGTNEMRDAVLRPGALVVPAEECPVYAHPDGGMDATPVPPRPPPPPRRPRP